MLNLQKICLLFMGLLLCYAHTLLAQSIQLYAGDRLIDPRTPLVEQDVIDTDVLHLVLVPGRHFQEMYGASASLAPLEVIISLELKGKAESSSERLRSMQLRGSNKFSLQALRPVRGERIIIQVVRYMILHEDGNREVKEAQKLHATFIY